MGCTRQRPRLGNQYLERSPSSIERIQRQKFKFLFGLSIWLWSSELVKILQVKTTSIKVIELKRKLKYIEIKKKFYGRLFLPIMEYALLLKIATCNRKNMPSYSLSFRSVFTSLPKHLCRSPFPSIHRYHIAVGSSMLKFLIHQFFASQGFSHIDFIVFIVTNINDNYRSHSRSCGFRYPVLLYPPLSYRVDCCCYRGFSSFGRGTAHERSFVLLDNVQNGISKTL